MNELFIIRQTKEDKYRDEYHVHEFITAPSRGEAWFIAGARHAKLEHLDDLSEQEILNHCIAWNLQRRHLSDGQRAMVAASIAQYQVGANQHSGGVTRRGS